MDEDTQAVFRRLLALRYTQEDVNAETSAVTDAMLNLLVGKGVITAEEYRSELAKFIAKLDEKDPEERDEDE